MGTRLNYFTLRTAENHAVQFNMLGDTITFEFTYNGYEEKEKEEIRTGAYFLSVYKNGTLLISSLRLNFSLVDLLEQFTYLNIGRLGCVNSEMKNISADNILNTIFCWEFEDETI
jgi:hypothetical protein